MSVKRSHRSTKAKTAASVSVPVWVSLRRSPRFRLALALFAAAAILGYHRDVYWRAFDDHPQESTVWFHAFGFAAASTASLWPNPLVARHIDVRESQVKPYNHWPNGFFLFFEFILRIFGRTEIVGRWVAILGTLMGFALIMISLGRDDWLVYACLPLLLLSAAGRDSVGFIFIDVALNLSMGVLLWIVARRAGGRHYNLVFRAALLAALACNHLIAPFAAVVILLKWRESRSARGLAIDAAILAAGFFTVLLALAAGVGSMAGGAAELLRIFRLRSHTATGQWAGALYGEWRDLFNLGPAGALLVLAAWLVTGKVREWRTAALLPSYLLFTLLLRQYVGGHHFARLPFVFFSLLTVAVAAEITIQQIDSTHLRGLMRLAAVVMLALPISAGKQQYEINLGMQISRSALARVVGDPVQATVLEGCNAFRFEPDFREEGFDPFGLLGQFYFGQQVVNRVRRDDPIRPCTVNWERSVVRAIPYGRQ